ncbi:MULTISPECIES: hypothetical protein [unclassified Acidovorax]|nr:MULTISPECIES: hypothetical protein [unclassified Acidovorax]
MSLDLCLYQALNIADKSGQLWPVSVHIELAHGNKAHGKPTRRVFARPVQNEISTPRQLALNAQRRNESLGRHWANFRERGADVLEKFFVQVASEQSKAEGSLLASNNHHSCETEQCGVRMPIARRSAHCIGGHG